MQTTASPFGAGDFAGLIYEGADEKPQRRNIRNNSEITRETTSPVTTGK